ncbi:hypothetical protein PREVCOP_06547 [Segatella copri DSM 18205]|uniref:Uncharacterized protein n=1 Tax=Segatella copri DSM 18205 TaxID=537011 RepID=D1PH27_9BACT|nr:hypothetical protein PREVCOP_06547 [Segatella copri DSM 18205]
MIAVPIAEQIAAANIQRSFSVMGVSVFVVSICVLFLYTTNDLQRQLQGGVEV